MKILKLVLAISFASSAMFPSHAQMPKNTYSLDVQVKTQNGILEGVNSGAKLSQASPVSGLPFCSNFSFISFSN